MFHMLSLPVPPKIAPFSFGEEPLSYGDSALIYCSITSGDFPVRIQWYLNEVLIDHLDPFYNINQANFGKKAKALSIDGVNEKHVGNYTCRATNHAETTSSSAELLVNGEFLCTLLFTLQSLPKSVRSHSVMNLSTTKNPSQSTVVSPRETSLYLLNGSSMVFRSAKCCGH